MNKKETNWYSVRCIFKLSLSPGAPDQNVYEERVTVWQATSFEEAIELAEEEANEYASEIDDAYLGIAQAFQLSDEPMKHGSEVFSLMRQSELAPDQYVDRFFDTGDERVTKAPE